MLAFGACALFGSVKKARSGRSLCDAEALVKDLGELGDRMRLRREPLDEISARLAAEGGCRALWKGISQGLAEGRTFSEAYALAEKPPVCREVMSVVDELASSLGTGAMEDEIKRLGEAMDKLGTRLAELEKADAERSKLTGSLSVLLGLAAALLLL